MHLSYTRNESLIHECCAAAGQNLLWQNLTFLYGILKESLFAFVAIFVRHFAAKELNSADFSNNPLLLYQLFEAFHVVYFSANDRVRCRLIMYFIYH